MSTYVETDPWLTPYGCLHPRYKRLQTADGAYLLSDFHTPDYT